MLPEIFCTVIIIGAIYLLIWNLKDDFNLVLPINLIVVIMH